MGGLAGSVSGPSGVVLRVSTAGETLPFPKRDLYAHIAKRCNNWYFWPYHTNIERKVKDLGGVSLQVFCTRTSAL